MSFGFGMADEKGKRIREEFGFASEREAVKEYRALNRDLMYPNYPLIADEIILRLGLREGAVLDIGTGLGSLAFEFAKRLPDCKVLGLDVSGEMLEAAGKFAREAGLKNVQFICGDAQKTIFPDNSFDLVLSFGLLHHLRDLRMAFCEIRRVLKKKARAYIYDLRKDAPEDIVAQIAAGMNPSQRRAFLESVKEAYLPAELEEIIASLGLAEYSLSSPEFSRQTIVKNIKMLKESKLAGGRFNKILVEISLVK